MHESASATRVPNSDVFEQVEKILTSRSFAGSETMRHLLSYLAQRTVESPDDAPKEHEIAVDLLGRPPDFDPKLDPVVRVQTSRLRSKLAEYYVGEGASDRVLLTVPKGTYCLQASLRLVAETAAAERVGPAKSTSRPRTALVMMGTGVLAVAGLVLWITTRPPGDARLRQFWLPFLESTAEPLVVYANPRFVGSSDSGLRLFDPSRDHAEAINPGYTGAGEVKGASDLTRLFMGFRKPLRMKRSQLFAWDDAKAYNLIFLGAPPHNVSLFQVPLGRKLKIKPYGDEPRRNEGCIQNLSPGPGEEEFYCNDIEGSTNVEYSLATMTAGVDRSKVVLVIAGATTFGTEATTEYLCNADRIAEFNRSLASAGRDSGLFDALFRCRLRGGVPIDAELVLVKK